MIKNKVRVLLFLQYLLFLIANEQQEIELEGLRQDFDQLKALVHSMLPRIDKIEKEKGDLEQYGRSNCLIVHGCKEAPK